MVERPENIKSREIRFKKDIKNIKKHREEITEQLLNNLKNLEIKVGDETIKFEDKDLEEIKKHLTDMMLYIFKNVRRGFETDKEFLEQLKLKFQENIKNLSLDAKAWKKVLLKYPHFFYRLPDKIKDNIINVSKLLEIDKKDYLEKVALKNPQLLALSPKKINDNITGVCKLLEIDKKYYLENLVLKEPRYLNLSPETIKLKFDLYKRFINLNEKSIRVLIFNKFPKSFTIAPEKIIAHYVLVKLSKRGFDLAKMKLNPLEYAEKILNKEPKKLDIFKIFYNYLIQKFEKQKTKIKKIKIKTGGAKEKDKFVRFVLEFADSVEKYFGKKDEELTLTDDMLNKIKEELIKSIEEKSKKQK